MQTTTWMNFKNIVISKKKVNVLITRSCLTLCDFMDCKPPGSSVHGILQARILEWVAIPFSGGFYPLRDQTQVSCIAGRFFIVLAVREAQEARCKRLPFVSIK